MDYSALLSKFEDILKIPYDELLQTREWMERRNNILERDKSCCTRCGKTKSFYFMNFNIAVDTRDRLITNSIVYNNQSIANIKTQLQINKISAFSLPHENKYFGISENGHLFLLDWEQVQGVSPEEIVINRGFTQLGKNFLILGKQGQSYFENNFAIPYLSEKQIFMHVHHKFYIKEKLPWEYDDDALVTLCNWCHWELHQQIKVPVYTLANIQLLELNYTPCGKCHGAGVLPEYKHVQNGVCFRCNGTRYEELIT